ncbi:hypothetical protein PPERSA_04975 [Pseudocohnilembus persalinus]|uniref:Kinase domain protein n=1 Tax=Pseudocohnilembus persalinus TaxID=266149 RepID=A0A0V0QWE1_PSEPJ|nr:hypothetical protein PPERSA_04975 [Pseudocohnilembus persalinus]|eukprot:KRX06362.1 hypothetical protein PPERSA_04975 [Pseudocohnilembus persalinus]
MSNNTHHIFSQKQLENSQNSLQNLKNQNLILNFSQKTLKNTQSFFELLNNLKLTLDSFSFCLDQEESDSEEEEEKKNKEQQKFDENDLKQLFKFIKSSASENFYALNLYLDRLQLKKGGIFFANGLKNLGNKIKNLEISLNENNISEDFLAKIFDGIETCAPSLQKLVFLADKNKIKDFTQISEKISKNLFPKLSKINNLQISFNNNKFLNENFVLEIFEGLSNAVKNKQIQNLHTLELSFDGTNFSQNNQNKVFDKLKELLLILEQSIPENKLQRVYISFEESKNLKNQLGLQKLREISDQFKQFIISYDEKQIEFQDFYKFKKQMENQQNLQKFQTNTYNLVLEFPDQAVMDHDIKFLIETLKPLKDKLRFLDIDLSSNDLTDKSFQKLAQFIQSCKKLKQLELTLAKNDLTDDFLGQTELFQSQKYLESFTLDIFNNQKITDKFFENLVDQILKQSNTLRFKLETLKLYLGDSKEQISDVALANISKIFKNQQLINLTDFALNIRNCQKITKNSIQQNILNLIFDPKILNQQFQQTQKNDKNDQYIENLSNLKNIDLGFQDLNLSEEEIQEIITQLAENNLKKIKNLYEYDIEIDFSDNKLNQQKKSPQYLEIIQQDIPNFKCILFNDNDQESENDENSNDESECSEN